MKWALRGERRLWQCLFEDWVFWDCGVGRERSARTSMAGLLTLSLDRCWCWRGSRRATVNVSSSWAGDGVWSGDVVVCGEERSARERDADLAYKGDALGVEFGGWAACSFLL
jgi:hypothetical protein